MRLVDVDKLLRDIPLKVCLPCPFGEEKECTDCVIDKVMETIEKAPTVEPASPWHRVEERPDEHTNLWLHDERGNYHVGCISTYRGYTEYIDMDGNTLHDIDYWMPIEPPKEDA